MASIFGDANVPDAVQSMVQVGRAMNNVDEKDLVQAIIRNMQTHGDS